LANSKGKPGHKKPAPQKSSRGANWYLLRIAGAVLGGLFFYAGVQKHYHSYEFAEAVLAYQLAPVALVVSFLLIMLVTLARGLNIDCGCGLFFQRQVGAAALLEDLAFLAWAGGLYWWEVRTVSSKL
jgi:hypothetical protein